MNSLPNDNILDIASNLSGTREIKEFAREILKSRPADKDLSTRLMQAYQRALQKEKNALDNLSNLIKVYNTEEGVLATFKPCESCAPTIIEPNADGIGYGVPEGQEIELVQSNVEGILREVVKNTEDMILMIRENIKQMSPNDLDFPSWTNSLSKFETVVQKIREIASQLSIQLDEQKGGKPKKSRYEKRTLSELKELAKTRGIARYSTMNKKDIIAALRK